MLHHSSSGSAIARDFEFERQSVLIHEHWTFTHTVRSGGVFFFKVFILLLYCFKFAYFKFQFVNQLLEGQQDIPQAAPLCELMLVKIT